MSRSAFLLIGAALLVACGGPAADPNAPEDGVPHDDAPVDTDGEPSTDTPAGDSDKPAPGGIVRDADGDGIPDDKEVAPCEEKNETQCKINMECAWSAEGKCVKAKAGM